MTKKIYVCGQCGYKTNNEEKILSHCDNANCFSFQELNSKKIYQWSII